MARRDDDTAYDLVLTRWVPAPRALVWSAWTDPARLAAWWGPHDFTAPRCEVDARPGGLMRIDMRAPDGTIYPMSGEFHELSPPERLVFTSAALDTAGAKMFEVRQTVTLAERDGGTMLTLRAEVVAMHHPDAANYLSQMELGWSSSLDKFALRVREEAEGVLIVTRRFAATPEQVFDAWLDPVSLGKWLFATPTGVMRTVEADPRVGGRFLIAEQRGAVLAEHHGEYRVIERPHRLVFAFADTAAAAKSEITVEIEAVAGGALLTLTHRLDPAWQAYSDKVRGGWTMILQSLELALAADRTMTISRLIAAPRALVWRAWTDPAHLPRWWGPKGFTCETAEIAIRPCGTWRFIMRGPDGTAYRNRIYFEALHAPDRITYVIDDDGVGEVKPFRGIATFEEREGGTLVTMRVIFDSAATLQAVARFGAKEGGESTLECLADHVEGMTMP